MKGWLSEDEPRLLIAAGGTGGHLFPALAVAQALRAQYTQASVLFVGGRRGLEREIVPRHGFQLATLPSDQLKGVSLVRRLRAITGLAPNSLRAMRLLRTFRPQIVLGAGGYTSAPMALASALSRTPLVLLEQNAVPGFTTRVLSRLARCVVTAFPGADERLPAGRSRRLGNPVRPDLAGRLLARSASPSPRQLLVLGGSQGARAVNDLVLGAALQLSQAMPSLLVTHQTGARDHDRVQQAYRRQGLKVRVQPFIEDVASAYLAADLVVGRAGATTIAELSLAGLPAILIPYPFAADDHQAANAEVLARAGAAVVYRQDALNSSRLAGQVVDLLGNPDRLASMAAAARQCSYPDAAGSVVDLLFGGPGTPRPVPPRPGDSRDDVQR